MKDYEFIKNDILDNKIFLEITFNTDNTKIQDCKDIINESKINFLEFNFPLKKDINNNECLLTFSTKGNTYVENKTIDEFYNILKELENIKSITNVRWKVYSKDNKTLYYYTYIEGNEDLEINIY